MAVVKIVHHNKGYRALLVHPAVRALVNREAERIAARAGRGYDAQDQTRIRARATVMPVTASAKRDNMKRNTLLRALGSARR